MEFQHAAKVLEGKLVVAALDIHGELVDRTIHEGLRGWKGDVYAVGGHRGGIEGAEGTVAHLTAHVVKHRYRSGSLRGCGIDTAAGGAVYHNLVATHPVEGGAVEGGFAVLVGATLHGGAELRTVAHLLLLAGRECEQTEQSRQAQ